MARTSEFETSKPLINQLQHNIIWGQKGNFLDVPTDCPQRDERLGWTGDAQVFSRTAAFNMDVAGFFTKWLKDVAADQFASGSVPHVVPNVLPDFDGQSPGGAAGWADVAVIIPWNMYLSYGDKRVLETQYDSMARWVDYEKTRAGDDYIWDGDFHFGDWLAFATTARLPGRHHRQGPHRHRLLRALHRPAPAHGPGAGQEGRRRALRRAARPDQERLPAGSSSPTRAGWGRTRRPRTRWRCSSICCRKTCAPWPRRGWPRRCARAST